MIDETYAATMRQRNAARRKHGTGGRYRRGCRCAACCQRNRRACADYGRTRRMLAQLRGLR